VGASVVGSEDLEQAVRQETIMSDKEAVKRKVMYLMKETIVGQLRANWGVRRHHK
jgi:hypothetical protein